MTEADNLKKKKSACGCGHDHHAHGHEHGAPRQDLEPLDPASAALADALRISFVILKLVMVAVVAMFIIGGIYKVEQNEQALVLRFGQVVGTGPDRIKTPGPHWALPRPIDEIIIIPGANTVRDMTVRSLWYYESEKERAGLEAPRPQQTLQIVRDGYTLTASQGQGRLSIAATATGTAVQEATDYNIMHSLWQIFYSVSNPITFVEKLWSGDVRDWGQVENLLNDILCDAVIVTCAHRDINKIIWGDEVETTAFREDVVRRVTGRLEALDVGLTINQINLQDRVVPRQVKDAFDRATSARNEADKRMTQARARADEIVGQAQADAEIMLAQAEAYRKQVAQAAKADADRLSEMLGKMEQTVAQKVPGEGAEVRARRQTVYNELLGVTVDELYQETLRDVMASADEVFVASTPEGSKMQWRAYFSRDPSLGKKTEKKNEGRPSR